MSCYPPPPNPAPAPDSDSDLGSCGPPLPVVGVLVSGTGSNLRAIIQATRTGLLGAKVGVVISSNPQVPALSIAMEAGIPAVVCACEDHRCAAAPPGQGVTAVDAHRAARDRALVKILREHRVEYVALAGYMRLIGPVLLKAYPWRIMNVHPSLLPRFPGLGSVEQALAARVEMTGCSVHLVDEGVDTGPVVVQAPVPVLEGDGVETLTARIHQWEHRIFPWALNLLVGGRLHVVDGRVYIHSREELVVPPGFMIPPDLLR